MPISCVSRGIADPRLVEGRPTTTGGLFWPLTTAGATKLAAAPKDECPSTWPGHELLLPAASEPARCRLRSSPGAARHRGYMTLTSDFAPKCRPGLALSLVLRDMALRRKGLTYRSYGTVRRRAIGTAEGYRRKPHKDRCGARQFLVPITPLCMMSLSSERAGKPSRRRSRVCRAQSPRARRTAPKTGFSAMTQTIVQQLAELHRGRHLRSTAARGGE